MRTSAWYWTAADPFNSCAENNDITEYRIIVFVCIQPYSRIRRNTKLQHLVVVAEQALN